MGDWTHAMCPECWNEQRPETPVVNGSYGTGPPEYCCFCGEFTDCGIYVRHDPNGLRCAGHSGD